jgi:hypothetical protein
MDVVALRKVRGKMKLCMVPYVGQDPLISSILGRYSIVLQKFGAIRDKLYVASFVSMSQFL